MTAQVIPERITAFLRSRKPLHSRANKIGCFSTVVSVRFAMRK